MSEPAEAAEPARIGRGSGAYWRANVALFISAFCVFALLYSVQPLLPAFAGEFGLGAGGVGGCVDRARGRGAG